MSYFFEKRLVYKIGSERSVARDLSDSHGVENLAEPGLEVADDEVVGESLDFLPQAYLNPPSVIVTSPDFQHYPATPESATIAKERRRRMESLLNPGYEDCMKEWKEEYVHKLVQYKLDGKDYVGKILSYSSATNELYLSDFKTGHKLFVPMRKVRLLA